MGSISYHSNQSPYLIKKKKKKKKKKYSFPLPVDGVFEI